MTDSHELTLSADPIEGLLAWHSEAEKAGLPEPSAMTLATVSLDLKPSARVVLFKGLSQDSGGLRCPRFFTNYTSRKSQEIKANPNVALVFHWTTMERQIRIEGRAERVSFEESQAYFQSRPRGSQIGAWASPQSQKLYGREELEKLVNEIELRYEGVSPLPCPDYWGGWRVVPEKIEFWHGVASRLHDRFVFTRVGSTWTKERLAP